MSSLFRFTNIRMKRKCIDRIVIKKRTIALPYKFIYHTTVIMWIHQAKQQLN